MPLGREDPRRFGLYLALAQAGLEMIAPLALGLVLDRMLGWTPWLTIGGAIGGFIGGLAHMVILAQRLHDIDKPDSSSRPSDPADRKAP